MDWRELQAERFDTIASIGMVEHVGSRHIDEYAFKLASLLGPGGRLLNHGIGRVRHTDPEAGPFSERYVFPDGAPLHLSRIQVALERAGFITDTVEGFQFDYAETLKHWYENLDSDPERARALAGDERLRVWRLYLRTARQGFLTGFIGLWQVLAHTPPAQGDRPVGADAGAAVDLHADEVAVGRGLLGEVGGHDRQGKSRSCRRYRSEVGPRCWSLSGLTTERIACTRPSLKRTIVCA